MKFFLYVLAVSTIFIVVNAQAQWRLFEGYTNFNCANCAVDDHALDQYAASNPDLAVIWVHDNFPDPGDLFYKDSKNSADYRTYNFWNVSADPQGFVNGSDAGQHFGAWHPALLSASSTYPAKVEIGAPTWQSNVVTLTVHLTGSTPVPVRLNVALTESGINYTNTESLGDPDGSPVWNDVLRTILPAPQGTDPFTLSGSKDVIVTADFTGKDWNKFNMKVIAFLQDAPATLPTDGATIEGVGVYQDFSGVSGSRVVEKSLIGTPSPNPFTGTSELPITLSQAAHVRIEVSDLLGRQIAIPADRIMGQGHSTVTVNGALFAPGLYQARMYIDGVYAGMTKLMNMR